MADDLSNAPLNHSDDFQEMMMQDSNVMSISEDPLVGSLTILTTKGHYDFLINQELANELIQNLREFLRGESENLLDD
ncbi:MULTISPECIES: hypothetical protein [unclassified Bradyrhizobium]